MNNQSNNLNSDAKINNQDIHIRPIRGDDLLREKQFVEQLSTESRHFRFLGGKRRLTDREAHALCTIDYDEKMAFIAVTKEADGEEREIGVSRYATDNDDGCECAVTIADEWQHHGLGQILMTHLIDFARDKGKHSLYSIDLADNTHMRQLAKELGMSHKRDLNDATLVRYELRL